MLITLPAPRFMIGQLVHHTLLDYRGVVIDIDETFTETDDWGDLLVEAKPNEDTPWYRVLVHGQEHETYVAESHLEPDRSAQPIAHPLITEAFDAFVDGHYVRIRDMN